MACGGPWQPMAVGDGSLVDKFAHAIGWRIRSTTRTALAPFWASWADVLGMLSHRLPALTGQILVQLVAEPAGEGCVAQLCGATKTNEQLRCSLAAYRCITEHHPQKRPTGPRSCSSQRVPRQNTTSSCPVNGAAWWWSLSRLAASGAVKRLGVPSSDAPAGIRFPLVAKKMDQVAVRFLRKGLCDLSGLVKSGDS